MLYAVFAIVKYFKLVYCYHGFCRCIYNLKRIILTLPLRMCKLSQALTLACDCTSMGLPLFGPLMFIGPETCVPQRANTMMVLFIDLRSYHIGYVLPYAQPSDGYEYGSDIVISKSDLNPTQIRKFKPKSKHYIHFFYYICI